MTKKFKVPDATWVLGNISKGLRNPIRVTLMRYGDEFKLDIRHRWNCNGKLINTKNGIRIPVERGSKLEKLVTMGQSIWKEETAASITRRKRRRGRE